MRIILLKSVKNLGAANEMKDVKEGYARNFLIPAGLAKAVNKHEVFVLESQKKKAKKEEVKNTKENLNIFNSLADKTFDIEAKTDDKGSLYVKLNAEKIVELLRKQGYKFDVGWFNIKEAIKKVGVYQLDLTFQDKKISITINIKSAI